MAISIVFVIGAMALFYFTYLDYKHAQIENQPILAFILIALVFSFSNHQLWLDMAVMAFIFALGYYLWKKGAFGGADVKILPGIVPFLGLSGFGATLAGLMVFLALFAIIGGIYGLLSKLIVKNKEIPFLPAITLTFLVFWIFYKGIGWGLGIW